MGQSAPGSSKRQLSAEAYQQVFSGEGGVGTVLEGEIEYGYLEIGIWLGGGRSHYRVYPFSKPK